MPSNDDDLELAVTVEVAEISGSETFLRVRIATEANIAVNDDFALLAHDGAESAGSLTPLPPGKTLAPGTRHPGPLVRRGAVPPHRQTAAVLAQQWCGKAHVSRRCAAQAGGD